VKSWHITRKTELLQRFLTWHERLVDFLGDCSKHCLTATMWFSVLTDRGPHCRQWRYSVDFLSPWICPEDALLWLWLERPCLESLSVFSLGLGNCFRRVIGICNCDPLLHGIFCCLFYWSWEIILWNCKYDLPGKQKPGLIWYEIIAIIKSIHLFGPHCI